MKKFDLRTEKWIPCFLLQGEEGKPQYLGLENVLLNAHSMREVRDDSPCVMAALLRLLLAILYDCFDWARATGDDEWEQMWKDKQFPSAALTKYFDDHAECFDLFHTQKPFFQIPDIETFSLKVEGKKKDEGKKRGEVREDSPISRLMLEVASNNNTTLFDHSFNDDDRSHDPATVARALVAAQSYSLSGGNTARYHWGEKTLPPQNFKFQAAPLVSGAAMWLSGASLFETLMLNLFPDDFPNDKVLWNLSSDDLESLVTDFTGDALRAGAPMEQFVFPARVIRLEPEEDLTVRRMSFTQGRRTDKKADDPMKTYFIKKAKNDSFRVPLALDKNRALWRDAHALLHLQPQKSNPKEGRGVKALYNAARSCVQSPISLHVAGLVVESSAKVVLWRHERLSVPHRLLQDHKSVERLGELVGEAESIAVQLQTRLKTLCEILYAPDYGRKDSNRKKPEAKNLQPLLQRFDTSGFYWAVLGQQFETLLARLGAEDDIEAVSDWWCGEVELTARRSLEDSFDRLGTTRRDLLARRALAEIPLFFSTQRTKAARKRQKEANKTKTNPRRKKEKETP